MGQAMITSASFNGGEGEASPCRDGGVQTSAAPSGLAALTTNLIEKMISHKNITQAIKRVRGNKGSPGVDGMSVYELPEYLKANWPQLRDALVEGRYRPHPVKRVEIPKPDGGMRELGIPTVVDRLIQQALLQVLESVFDPSFSTSSYGFRPGRSAHQALVAAKKHVESGKVWVVDLDLEKFFDRVNHDILMSRLAKRIGDKRVLRLIRRFLEAGAMVSGVVMERSEGTPQGGPISPLLANILLDEFDKELEKRGHSFCRYADDCNIYVGSKRAGERVMASLVEFLEKKLKLRVNCEKSGVARTYERKFLGMRIAVGERAKICLAPKSLIRFKKTVRRITKRNRGISLDKMLEELNRFTMGWVNYFSLAEAESTMRKMDSWIRRRLRCFIWKQWKNYRTRVRHLLNAGVGPYLAWGIVSGKHGLWAVAGCPAMTIAVTNRHLEEMGYKSLTERYMSLKSN
jgi:RNA-directed DNA polymerase